MQVLQVLCAGSAPVCWAALYSLNPCMGAAAANCPFYSLVAVGTSHVSFAFQTKMSSPG
jgi:hypothetical protein